MDSYDSNWIEIWVKKSLIWKLVGFLNFVGSCCSIGEGCVELDKSWFRASFEEVASSEGG
jgi:hypothetical protein